MGGGEEWGAGEKAKLIVTNPDSDPTFLTITVQPLCSNRDDKQSTTDPT